MQKITTLNDLYIQELSNLYNAEIRILKILPLMASNVKSPELKETLENHMEQTQVHIERLEKVFKNKEMNPMKKKCAVMEGLAEESKSVIRTSAEPLIKDIVIISYTKKIAHYEIAGYGCAVTYAKCLGETENQDILQATLDEEIETEEVLSEIADESLTGNAIEVWEEEQVL